MAVVTEDEVAVHTVSVSDRYSVMYATGGAGNTYVLRRSKPWGVVAGKRGDEGRDCRFVASELHVGCEQRICHIEPGHHLKQASVNEKYLDCVARQRVFCLQETRDINMVAGEMNEE
jgi:hypothetical protein